ncbi:MAG: cob(I)yrinic acid a,c-diamide adenosyltransferase, partial [Thermoplasmatales archaeon]|nr:cob(I)yrinic acid a,c-diamide adenosyltransferase [Thermoplasmatales archaeon]
KNTSKKTELILTGRYMPEEFIKYADLISEVRDVKHHFQAGVPARKGIEY